MQVSFWRRLENSLGQLHGPGLAFAVIVWVLLMGLGLFCAFGGMTLPSPSAEKPKPTATTQAQAAVNTPVATVPGAITLPTPTATMMATQNLPPLPWGEFGYGIAIQGVVPVNGDYFYTMRQAKQQLGLGWIKQQLRWDDVEKAPGQYDWTLYEPVVDSASQTGLKIMLSIVGAPQWSRSYIDSDPEKAPPDDLSLYANFVGQVVDRYKGRIHAVEIWNEQNLNREWDNAEGVNAQRYVEMLRLAYQAVKSRDPNIIVISGALSPTGAEIADPNNPNRWLAQDDFAYLQRMIEAGYLDYVDCTGVHHNGINMPPNVAWDEGYNDPTAAFRGPFENPHHSWSFKSTLWGYHDMIQKAGHNTPLCITEFGWASAQGWSQVPVGFEFARDNTLEEQAQWTVEAYQLMRQWGFVRLAFLWNLDYGQKGGVGESDPNAPYSIIEFNGAPRPAYGAVGQMPKVP